MSPHSSPAAGRAARFAARTAQARKRTAIPAALLTGGIAALGQAPLGLWPLSLLGFAGLFGLYLFAPTIRRAAWLGWAGGTGYFLLSLSWIVEPFLIDIARHGWMAPFALGLLAAGLALFWALAFALARWAGGSALALLCTFPLAEALRGWIFTGFPWAQPGHIWIGTPLMPLAALTGALGLILATLLLALLLWRALTGHRPALVLSALALAALLLTPLPAGPVAQDAPTVRLIQPNASQRQKWDPAMIPVFFQRQVDFTRTAPRPDLVVWPETAIPTLLNDAAGVLDTISTAAGPIPVVLGAQRRDGARRFNSLAVLDGQGEVTARYDKHHLVPFGEYVPYGNILKRFGLRGLASRDGFGYSPGPGPRVIDLGPLGRALPLICYEGVFPRDVAAAPQRADFILLITNDAWFGRLSGPYQHLAQARLRSVEQGLPMIRVANTGVSAMIDAKGRVTASLPLGQAGFVDAALPSALPPTLYSRTGDLPLLILLCIGLGVAFATARRRASLSR